MTDADLTVADADRTAEADVDLTTETDADWANH
jgi:hypothetical protein